MPKKILVTGGDGRFAQELKKILKWNYLEIGIGCGQFFILTKNIMVIFML